MKKNIHPATYPVVFIDSSCGARFITTSTLNSDETEDINGVPHKVIRVEISSASHPFYTGKQIFIDAAQRVDKFAKKLAQAKDKSASGGKKVRRAARAAKKTTTSETKA